MAKMKEQSIVNEEGVIEDSLIVPLPGFFAGSTKFYHKKSSPIVQHFEHAYDKDHNVIVIEGKSENRQEVINSYERLTGVANILELVEKTGDWSLANKADTICGDVSAFTGNPIEVEEKILQAQKDAADSLNAFNKKFGTNFTRDQFLKLVDSGEFEKVIKDLASKGGNDDEKSNS